MRILLASLIFLPLSVSAQNACKFCVENDRRIVRELGQLAQQSEARILRTLQREKIRVLVVESGRKSPETLFSWAKQKKVNGEMAEFTARNNVLGMALCNGEHERAKGADTIVVASDSPRVMIFQQYLKIRQIRKDRSWCKTAKELWARDSTIDEDQMVDRREWDSLKTLWNNRRRLKLGIEDEIILSGELREVAAKMRKYDSTAYSFIQSENIPQFNEQKVARHKELFSKINYSREVRRFVTELSFKNKTAFMNQAYCFFVFHEVIEMDQMPPKKFRDNITAASLPLLHVQAYYDWLGTVVGEKCISKIGIDFELVKEARRGKSYAMFINEQVIREGTHPRNRTVAHEYLSIAYTKYKNRRPRVAKEWSRLSNSFKQRFKERHSGYNFSKAVILEREYFSHTYEPQLESGLKMLMERREDRLNTYQSFWKRRR